MRIIFTISICAFMLLVFAGCAKSKLEIEREAILENVRVAWKDVVIKQVSLWGSKAGAVTGLFMTPKKTLKGAHPAVLELHGYTDRKEAWLEVAGYSKGGSVTRLLLDKGFAVLAIDLPYHGARLPDSKTEKQKVYVLDNWSAFMAAALSDIKISVNFLSGQSNVDKKRIGIVGYSLGGMISYSAANTDTRVRALVTCVAPPDKGKSYPGAPHENIDRLGNVAVLVIAATQDHNYPVEDAVWFYDLLPSRVKEYVQYESNHSLPADYAAKAAGWFVRIFGR